MNMPVLMMVLTIFIKIKSGELQLSGTQKRGLLVECYDKTIINHCISDCYKQIK
jgi:hypothetical protein